MNGPIVVLVVVDCSNDSRPMVLHFVYNSLIVWWLRDYEREGQQLYCRGNVDI